MVIINEFKASILTPCSAMRSPGSTEPALVSSPHGLQNHLKLFVEVLSRNSYSLDSSEVGGLTYKKGKTGQYSSKVSGLIVKKGKTGSK